MFSLVLANIMSPRIWKWRDDEWFKGVENMKPYRRIQRLKQFIMDNYAFNLDLETWGMTTKQAEIERFRDFIDVEDLRRSNALFGYEGDKYYFDIDIRTHFGLDKYKDDVIPYWKTETVEAMDAFRVRDNFTSGAGECVSLAALYAAALFVVAGIPLSDIYLMATPLHSQNFVDLDEGILTNNRRLVTKNMWFNGTAISAQARRALENEQVTVVAHETGHIHVLYNEATISVNDYNRFSEKLKKYLEVELNDDTLGNFLRQSADIQKCFQIRWKQQGRECFIAADRVFAYERSCPYLLTDQTRARLMDEIDAEEFQCSPYADKIILNDLENFVRERNIDFNSEKDINDLRERFASDCLNAIVAIESMIKFCKVLPRLPDIAGKKLVESPALGLTGDMDREQVIERLTGIRKDSTVVDLAFHAYRDLRITGHAPFLKAALERNPVSVAALEDSGDEDVIKRLEEMPGDSIYDGDGRLAQPDEVWNFGRGDGLERALLLANVLRRRHADDDIVIKHGNGRVSLQWHGKNIVFDTSKNIAPGEWIVAPVVKVAGE